MKLVEQREDALVFELREWERHLLIAVLGRYPQVAPDYFPFSKQGLPQDKAEDAELHREMFAEEQGGNRREVGEFILKSLTSDVPVPPLKLCQFTLERSRVDWLLQVINDVRVGSWVKLDRPDEAKLRRLARQAESRELIEVMEFCGYVQMVLLDAVSA